MQFFRESTSDLGLPEERDWLRRVYGFFQGRITRAFETIARVQHSDYRGNYSNTVRFGTMINRNRQPEN